MKAFYRLTLCVVVTACQDVAGPSERPASRIRIGPEATALPKLGLGDTIQLTAHRLDASGTPILNDMVRFHWASSDTTVLTVDENGQAVLVGLGSADAIARIRDTGVVSAPAANDTGSGRLTLNGTYTLVDGGSIISAGMGGQHQCIVRDGGAAFCRGRNAEGQLGHGDVAASTEWVSVVGGHTFVSISVGQWHSCGLTVEHQAYCWGRGHHGELGNGRKDVLMSTTPLLVTGDHQWSSLDVGGHGATCGITLGDNVPYCFGHNDMGQTGRDPLLFADTLVAPISGSHIMSVILTEHALSCGLEVSGEVYCFGEGTGVPHRVGGTVVLDRISIGYSHGCGLTSAGAAYCWGNGEDGQLGTGEYTSSTTLRPVVDAPAFRSIHAFEGTSCGITDGGAIWCWGGNYLLALGRSNPVMRTNRPVHVRIDTPLRWIQNGDELGDEIYAITESGQLITWSK